VELLEDAERAASWLLERFEQGDHIAVWSPNVPVRVVLQYGAALAGMVLVSANPALRGAELAYVLRQLRAVGVAYAESFRGTDMAALVKQVLSELPALAGCHPAEEREVRARSRVLLTRRIARGFGRSRCSPPSELGLMAVRTLAL